MNRLTSALAVVCRDRLLQEKWLLAPALRAGHQWLGCVARSGRPVVNCHVKTIARLALELAAGTISARDVELISSHRAVQLVDQILHELRQSGGGYLRRLPPNIELSQMVHSAIDTLRRAGVRPEVLRPDDFESDEKGRELGVVLQRYVEELQERRLVDRADVLRMAIDALEDGTAVLADDVLVLVPADLDLSVLERALLHALPDRQRTALPVDESAPAPASETTPATDASLLRWLTAPADAPAANRDETCAIFAAIGETNEIREVLRRCLAAGHPLDEVELLYTDTTAYVPVIYEVFAQHLPEGTPLDDMPVTFQEGLPSTLFRPGRALVAWLEWIRADYPQGVLLRMIQEGLLQIPDADDGGFSFSSLAAIFRSVGIGFGRERYLPRLDSEIARLEHRLSEPPFHGRDEDEVAAPDRVRDTERRLHAVRLLRKLVGELLHVTPVGDAGRKEILDAADLFLTRIARKAVRLDHYARERLSKDITELHDRIGQHEGTSLDVWSWLAALPTTAWVGGSGPRGGCLHVAHVGAGGHSGRPHTFIVGLDDGRFPGAGLQDPVFLDNERSRVSSDLPTAAGRVQQRLRRFAELLARLRGTVVLSYPRYDVVEDRDIFPSPVLLSAFRLLSNQREGRLAEFLDWLPPAASFAPDREQRALSQSDWWLWRLSRQETVADPEKLLTACFPHLGRGFEAERARASDHFTEFDGWIPHPGPELDPTSAAGPVVSASRLELLAKCPLAYFFRYVLRIEPPDEMKIEPDTWLDPLTAGSLLHNLFERFLNRLIEERRLPLCAEDERLLLEDLDGLLSSHRELIPPPSEAVYRRQCRDLRQTARIFFSEELVWQRDGSRPAFLEASIGMQSRGGGTPLDTPEPVPVALPGGGQMRVRGRIDRVDRVDETGQALAIWDYKTGGAWRYRKEPPFCRGRVVQHALYIELLKAHLRTLQKRFPGASVRSFGFFFPGPKERGDRITFAPEDLSDGPAILDRLARIAATGAFLSTDSPDDCSYCDYQPICGDIAAVTAASKGKLDNVDNAVLQPYLELRRHADA